MKPLQHFYKKGREVVITAMYKGELQSHTMKEWQEITGVRVCTMKNRYYGGRSPEQIIGEEKIVIERRAAVIKNRRDNTDRVSSLINRFVLGENHESIIRAISATAGCYRK